MVFVECYLNKIHNFEKSIDLIQSFVDMLDFHARIILKVQFNVVAVVLKTTEIEKTQ